MKVTLTSTPDLVTLGGVTTRVWTGTTEQGCPVRAYIAAVAVDAAADARELELDLIETPGPPMSLHAHEKMLHARIMLAQNRRRIPADVYAHLVQALR